ncbi:MAG: alanine racemase [Chloroflexota bacterium]
MNLDAIGRNVSALKRAAGEAELMVVVKANGYGHGAARVAESALASGAGRLAVFTVDEGRDLREAGIRAPILVFGPWEQPEADALADLRLTSTISNDHQAGWLQTASRGRLIHVHLEIDSGLNRGGFEPSEAEPLLRRLARLQSVEVEGIFTHFASADNGELEPTGSQYRVFKDLVNSLESAGFHFRFVHAANSAAILDFPQTHERLVRAGISAYGYHPSGKTSGALALEPALALRSSVARLHTVRAGEAVGYGGEFVPVKDTPVALVPIGYGDGFPRNLGLGNGRVIIRGASLPVVGRVSMDQITVDASDVPDTTVGDEVVIIGRQAETCQTADDLAAWSGTISYEILSRLSPRIPRLYVRDADTSEVAREGETGGAGQA